MPAPRPRCGRRWSGCKHCRSSRISDFGTRRRHSFLWQRWCVEALKEGIGPASPAPATCCSRWTPISKRVGTNAHELPMVAAALAATDEELRSRLRPTRCSQDWNRLLRRQPADRAARCLRHRRVPARRARLGRRLDRLPPDSAPEIEGGEKIIAWWKKHGPRSAREAADLLRRPRRRRDHRGHLQAFRGPGAHELRLGHQPHQRLRRLRAIPESRSSIRFRWSARSARPTASQR